MVWLLTPRVMSSAISSTSTRSVLESVQQQQTCVLIQKICNVEAQLRRNEVGPRRESQAMT